MSDLSLKFLLVVLVTSVGFLVGFSIGKHDASERFYEQCQGGSVTMTYESGTVQVVGCAELARRIR